MEVEDAHQQEEAQPTNKVFIKILRCDRARVWKAMAATRARKVPGCRTSCAKK